MEIFNKIGDFANKTYQKTTQKTGEIAKEAKIKFKMNDDKSKINNLYQEIGKAIYRKHSNSEEISIDEKLNSYCTQIDELSKDLEDAQTELLKIKNKRICENCYAEIELNVKYCPHCGFEQPEIKQEEEEVKNEDNENKVEDNKVEENPQEENNDSNQ